MGGISVLSGGCERSLRSCPEAEIVGQGGEDWRQRAKKRATPGSMLSASRVNWWVWQTRCRSQGSPRGNLFVTTLSFAKSVSGQLSVHSERLHMCKMTTDSTSRSLLETSSRQLVRHFQDQGLALGLTASQRVKTQASLAQVHLHTHQPMGPVLRHLPTLAQHLDTTSAITPPQ